MGTKKEQVQLISDLIDFFLKMDVPEKAHELIMIRDIVKIHYRNKEGKAG